MILTIYQVQQPNGGVIEYLEEPQGQQYTIVEREITEEIKVVPESISQMKLRKQLILSGISISAIDALIQQLPQPNRDLIQTMWEYAVVFDRTNPELNEMAEMLGITQEQLDDIFINASNL